jgi:F0F1-type ATP synthase membrane subunit b/b'
MSEQRIKELEAELLAANESVAKLTQANAELTGQLKSSEQAFKRVRRSARQDGNTLRDEIAVLQKRRG